MQLREELERAIRRPVENARDAATVREAADLLGDYLRLEERAHRLLRGEAAATVSREGDLGGLSLHAAAERVLQDAGVPLHVKELGARIKAGGWRHPRSSNANPQRIFFQLAARLPRHPDTFRRVAPNTFGLTRWDAEGRTERPRRPRTGLFSGPGVAVGQRIGESDAHISDEDTKWRSS